MVTALGGKFALINETVISIMGQILPIVTKGVVMKAKLALVRLVAMTDHMCVELISSIKTNFAFMAKVVAAFRLVVAHSFFDDPFSEPAFVETQVDG